MKNSKTDRKGLIQWVVILTLMAILYFTGLYTEVIGGFQRILLSTGIIKPKTNIPASAVEEKEIVDIYDYKYDLLLKTIDGKNANLRDLKGKIVFLNIWATWCPPCIAEMPNIHNLYKKLDPAKIAFVMLSIDKDFTRARKFVERKNYDFPVYFPGGEMPEELKFNVVPTTFILATNGNILTRQEGMADYDNADFINYLNTLSETITSK